MDREWIPYAKQWIDEDDIDAVVEALKSDYLTTGPKIKEFEKKLADYVGVKYAVALSNGTAALHAACLAAGIGPGDEVVTSPMTFAASGNCVLYVGAKPVFADINPLTYNVDPEDIKRRITGTTKALIPVHYTGQPCNMDEVMKIARENNLVVIEDAAHALGAEYKGKKAGSMGHMAIFSFHPVKHITTGEGGMVVTNDRDIYEKLIMFKSHGITRDKSKLLTEEGPWYYEQQFLGYNYRMTDIQAALGVSQLGKLDDFIQKRRKLVELYNKEFENFEGIKTHHQMKEGKSAWHLYVIQLKGNLWLRRREIFEELLKRKIGVNVHYIPVYYHPFYQELGYKKGLCPNAEKLYEGIITLPLYPRMTEEDVLYVVKCVKEIC
ncbi:MAG: UDP-4-amino-4,6-dideoxy-N-acetyl-beta-L-altrosamine transaminase [Clostridia bacterium]|nr:UDP-4-amino-4,6-dideoxy-N-acetyl-beta-L-altrosamine transaminase [Clostridia bacterium]